MQKEVEIEPKRLRKQLPQAPPVKRDPSFYKDNYNKSFLLTFNLKKQNDEKLKQIILKNAHNDIELMQERYLKAQALQTDKEPEFPDELLSEDRKIRVNLFIIHLL